MQFQVPQFIDIEDKIVGPFSLKQFGYLAAAATLIFILFFILKTAFWIMLAIPVALFAIALALIKYNGRPLPYLMVSIAKHFWQPRFFLWQHGKPISAAPAVKVPTIKLPRIKIKPLATREVEPPKEVQPPKIEKFVPLAEPSGGPTSPELKPVQSLEVGPPHPKKPSPEAPRLSSEAPTAVGAKEGKSLLQLLGLKLAAYTHPIPRRERAPEPIALRTQPEGGAALLQRLMKERELARRVDYR